MSSPNCGGKIEVQFSYGKNKNKIDTVLFLLQYNKWKSVTFVLTSERILYFTLYTNGV